MEILNYNAICNLGSDIDEIFINAINGVNDKFEILENIIKGKKVRVAKVNTPLVSIEDKRFNIRCNQLILTCCKKIGLEKYIKKYGNENVAVVVATTNSGVEEYETTKNIEHAELGNPALFLKEYYNLNNYFSSVSTACSSGIKAFSIARELLNSDFAKAVIVVGVDSLAKVPIFGFDSLEVLTSNNTKPMSKNRDGINIGEAVAVFVVAKEDGFVEIAGIGENTDVYHNTTPDPEAKEEIIAIKEALLDANMRADDIDYINLHGTGTCANDLMEANAIYNVFEDKVFVSSTKPLTGHCLGAASSIETALCCKLLEENKNRKVYPHIYDGEFDENLPKIKLADKNTVLDRLNTCMCLSFGFGGTNAVMILRGKND